MIKNIEQAIQEAAYYNWQNAGCPQGQDEYFWTMAVEQFSNNSCKASSAKKCSSSCATKKSSTSSSKASASKSSSSAKKSSK